MLNIKHVSSDFLQHLVLSTQPFQLLAHAHHVCAFGRVQFSFDLLQLLQQLVALRDGAMLAVLELLDLLLAVRLGVLQLVVLSQDLLGQLEHLHVLLLVERRLHVHN